LRAQRRSAKKEETEQSSALLHLPHRGAQQHTYIYIYIERERERARAREREREREGERERERKAHDHIWHVMEARGSIQARQGS
jgi:hypothetical protein